ncbi:hypothetical protein BH10ACI1_BH10ACI1_16760 [soil metagenome]
MNLKTIRQLFGLRDLRNAALGFFVVFGGISLAALTFWASRQNNAKLAGLAAGISLVFVLLILIFVVPPLARSASSEASQMNLPFEITVGGAIILGLIVIVGFSAWNTGNNLLFLVLSFLIAAMIVGIVVGSFCLRKLDIKIRFSETVFAGEPTPILVSLNNRKIFLPTFSVVTEVRGREREKSIVLEDLKQILPAKWAEKLTRPPIIKHTLEYFIHVPRRAKEEHKVEHIFPYRGRFIIKDFELSTKFPFGFFRHRRRLSAQEAEIIIFPKNAPIEKETVDLPLEVGKFITQKKGLGQDLLALRDYQPADDLRHVDWKATARTNRLTVREFSAEDDRRVTIFFDTRILRETDEQTLTLRQKLDAEQKGSLAPASEKFEKGVSLTASLLTHFAEEQGEILLIIDEKKGEFGIGRTHLNECLKRLALVEPNFDETSEISVEALEEIFTDRENSYTFFVTAENETKFPGELFYKAEIVHF